MHERPHLYLSICDNSMIYQKIKYRKTVYWNVTYIDHRWSRQYSEVFRWFNMTSLIKLYLQNRRRFATQRKMTCRIEQKMHRVASGVCSQKKEEEVNQANCWSAFRELINAFVMCGIKMIVWNNFILKSRTRTKDTGWKDFLWGVRQVTSRPPSFGSVEWVKGKKLI